MEKLAETQYPIHGLLRRRWSPRAFSSRPVEPDKLRSLWEAARWAPSSYNEQPWSFIVATKDDEAEYARLLSCLVEGNIQWAQHAPVLMVSVARLSFEEDGKPNRHAFHDVGQAVSNLIVQATALGLVCIRWPASFRTRYASCTAFRKATRQLQGSRWAIPATLKFCRSGCASENWRHGPASPSGTSCLPGAGGGRRQSSPVMAPEQEHRI